MFEEYPVQLECFWFATCDHCGREARVSQQAVQDKQLNSSQPAVVAGFVLQDRGWKLTQKSRVCGACLTLQRLAKEKE